MTTFEKFAIENNLTSDAEYNMHNELFNNAVRIAKNINNIDLSKENTTAVFLAVSALKENNEQVDIFENAFAVETKFNFRFIAETMCFLVVEELTTSIDVKEEYEEKANEVIKAKERAKKQAEITFPENSNLIEVTENELKEILTETARFAKFFTEKGIELMPAKINHQMNSTHYINNLVTNLLNLVKKGSGIIKIDAPFAKNELAKTYKLKK